VTIGWRAAALVAAAAAVSLTVAAPEAAAKIDPSRGTGVGVADRPGDTLAGLPGDLRLAEISVDGAAEYRVEVVTFDTADPIRMDGRTRYSLDVGVSGCGTLHVWAVPGGPAGSSGGSLDCAPAGVRLGILGMRAGSQRLEFRISRTVRALRPPMTLTGLDAATEVVDPLWGQLSPAQVSAAARSDSATWSGRYVLVDAGR
jgi:hypothetical protein